MMRVKVTQDKRIFLGVEEGVEVGIVISRT